MDKHSPRPSCCLGQSGISGLRYGAHHNETCLNEMWDSMVGSGESSTSTNTGAGRGRDSGRRSASLLDSSTASSGSAHETTAAASQASSDMPLTMYEKRVETECGLPDDFYTCLVAWSRNGHFEARGHLQHVVLYDRREPGAGPTHKCMLPEQSANYLTFLPSTSFELLTVGSQNGMIRFYDLTDLEELTTGSDCSLSSSSLSRLGPAHATDHEPQTAKYGMFWLNHGRAVTCLAYIPDIDTHAHSRHRLFKLLVGDETGAITVYHLFAQVEGPGQGQGHDQEQEQEQQQEPCSLTILSELHYELPRQHSSQVCSFAFNTHVDRLAVGGNDSRVSIYRVASLDQRTDDSEDLLDYLYALDHNAAIKAVEFCPWSAYILATGAGNNDRHLRLWNTESNRTGMLLREVHTNSQITSLLWLTATYSLLVTFGFGFVDHEIAKSFACYDYPLLRTQFQACIANHYTKGRGHHPHCDDEEQQDREEQQDLSPMGSSNTPGSDNGSASASTVESSYSIYTRRPRSQTRSRGSRSTSSAGGSTNSPGQRATVFNPDIHEKHFRVLYAVQVPNQSVICMVCNDHRLRYFDVLVPGSSYTSLEHGLLDPLPGFGGPFSNEKMR